MWLLDANMDVHLVELLNDLGVPAASATLRGWQALENGALVSAAAAAGFSCLLTRDRLFAESAAKTLKQIEGFAIVVVQIPQRPWRQYAEEFRFSWNRLPIQPVPGLALGSVKCKYLHVHRYAHGGPLGRRQLLCLHRAGVR